jgi:hypothetical protein
MSSSDRSALGALNSSNNAGVAAPEPKANIFVGRSESRETTGSDAVGWRSRNGRPSIARVEWAAMGTPEDLDAEVLQEETTRNPA